MDQLLIIKEMLEAHRGKQNRVTSSEIAIAIGNLNEDDTHADTRTKIKKCITNYNLPAVADNHGYYFAITNEELEKYMKNLDKRIAGILERKELVIKNYKEMKK